MQFVSQPCCDTNRKDCDTTVAVALHAQSTMNLFSKNSTVRDSTIARMLHFAIPGVVTCVLARRVAQ